MSFANGAGGTIAGESGRESYVIVGRPARPPTLYTHTARAGLLYIGKGRVSVCYFCWPR